jgi:hypothetical protein
MIEWREFIDGNASRDPLLDRTGMSYLGGLMYQVPVSIIDVILNAAYQQDSTKGTEYFMKGALGSVALRAYLLKDKLWLKAYASLNVRDFAKAEPTRLEVMDEFGGNLRWNMTRNLALDLSYSFTRNDASNTGVTPRQPYPEFSYRRNLATLGFIAAF